MATKSPLDRKKRFIAAELLKILGTLQAHLTHELYRVAHHQREGLTDAEYEYAMKLHSNSEKLMKATGTLRDRCRG